MSTPQQPPGSDPSLPGGVRKVDNGNTFVFCDHVAYFEDCHSGCVRGAGHNGPHLMAESYDPTNGPVLLRQAKPSEPSIPVSVLTEIVADLDWLARFCDQVVADGIPPSRAWFGETAATLRKVEALLQEKA